MRKTVLLVDDQIMFVENLKIVLETYADDLKIVATAHNGREAIQQAERCQPSIILMDLRMPVLDGVGATKRILTRFPRTRIIMLTVFDDDQYVYQALNNGASGYLLKNMRPEALVSSIHAVLDGAVLISPLVAQSLVGKRSNQLNTDLDQRPAWVSELGRREKQVLALILEDMSNDEIAEKLCIGPRTVRNYVSRIYEKIGAHNRFQAIRLARPFRLYVDPRNATRGEE